MQDAGYAALQIIPSFRGFQGNLERGVAGPMAGAGRAGGVHFGDAAGRSAGSRFGSVFRSTIAALGIYQLARAGINFLQDSVAEAREAQKVGAITAQVIKSTGGAAKVTRAEVEGLATALSLKTGVDDEVIQRGANMLLTFKNIRNEVGQNNDIFDQSVAITEDMAAAMAGGTGGGSLDLKSASIQVGKALNDPVKGVTALGRAGVQFTDQQKDQIEKLVENNDLLAAQKIVLGELESQFGGTARAQATMGEKVSVAWANIQEKLGTALLPLIHDVEKAFLRDGIPAAERFADWFSSDGVPAIRGFVDEVKPLAESALPAAASALDAIADAGKAALPYVKGTIDAFNDMPDWAQKAIAVGGAGAIVGSKLGLGSLLTGGRAGAGGGLLGGFPRSAPLPVYVVNNGPGLPGGGSGGGRRSPFWNPFMATLGLAAVPAAGGALVNHYTPQADLPTSTSPAAAGGGMSVPNDWNTDDLRINLGDIAKDLNPQNWGWSLPDDLFGAPAEAEVSDFRRQLEQTADLFATLPQQVKTDVILNGAPESRREANELARAYDLTGEQRTTLFRTLGIPLSTKQVAKLIGLYEDAARPRHGSIDIDTSAAQAKADRLLATYNAINRYAALHAAGVGPEAPSAPTSGDRPRGRAVGGRAPRAAQINVHLDGRVVGTVIDDRITTHEDLAAERGRAGAPR